MERLVTVVKELSEARDLDGVTKIVRSAARELANADGATFVLRSGELCHYVDEDAISPLWKGKKFPLDSCVSGWVMRHHEPAFIKDIYSDPRVPIDAYRPTFVRSLAMFPIRQNAPIGAIGLYWSSQHHVTDDEVRLVQTLADATSAILEKFQLHAELEQRVKERTAELEAANKELEAFSYAASHDLRAPLRSLRGFAEAMLEDHASQLDPVGADYLQRIHRSALQMTQLVEDLLALSQTTRASLSLSKVDLGAIAQGIAVELKAAAPQRKVTFNIAENVIVSADERLMQIVLENLFSNAWKFTSKREHAEIQFGVLRDEQGETYFVRDNGSGFDMAYAEKLFTPFQRLHSRNDFPGTGVGLATVQRILQKHDGTIWCHAAEEQGASFYFRLGTKQK
ncbi:MAG: sensor histidine kinase [Limisphaerales bacterium]